MRVSINQARNERDVPQVVVRGALTSVADVRDPPVGNRESSLLDRRLIAGDDPAGSVGDSIGSGHAPPGRGIPGTPWARQVTKSGERLGV